jgi:predicted alpha/beta-hydrolase family hydrolase
MWRYQCGGTQGTVVAAHNDAGSSMDSAAIDQGRAVLATMVIRVKQHRNFVGDPR